MSEPKPQTTTAAGRSVSWPRIAVTAVFVVHGLLFASWTAHIPDVKAHLGLTDGTLGFALLGAPVGSVIAMIAASWLLPKAGSRRIVQVALVGYCAATASACGWAGFVCGPPVIGRLSEWASLPVALGLLPLLTAFVVAGTLGSSALGTGRQLRARAQCATAR